MSSEGGRKVTHYVFGDDEEVFAAVMHYREVMGKRDRIQEYLDTLNEDQIKSSDCALAALSVIDPHISMQSWSYLLDAFNTLQHIADASVVSILNKTPLSKEEAQVVSDFFMS